MAKTTKTYDCQKVTRPEPGCLKGRGAHVLKVRKKAAQCDVIVCLCKMSLLVITINFSQAMESLRYGKYKTIASGSLHVRSV
jgi:hypothetical protein